MDNNIVTVNIANKLPFDIDVISLIISVLAIGISIWSVKRNEKIDYKKRIFEIAFKLLLEEFPGLLNSTIDESSCTMNEEACTKAEDAIRKYRDNILVLKYSDITSYKKIDQLLVSIEDKLIDLTNKTESTFFRSLYKEFLDTVNSLYKSIEKYVS